MALFSREADETGGATKRFDGVLELPNLRLPLLFPIQAEVRRAAYVPDLRDQPLVVGSQGVPPGVPFSRKLRRLLGDVPFNASSCLPCSWRSASRVSYDFWFAFSATLSARRASSSLRSRSASLVKRARSAVHCC